MSFRGPLGDREPVYASIHHEVWEGIFPLFKPNEFERPYEMDANFLWLLYDARVRAGVPFRILDSYRPDEDSAHGEVPIIAVDLQILNTYERFAVVQGALDAGFTRIGIYEGTDGEYKGERKRDGGGIHLDASRDRPQNRIWTMRR